MIEGDRYLAMYDSKMTRWRNLPVVFSIWEDSVRVESRNTHRWRWTVVCGTCTCIMLIVGEGLRRSQRGLRNVMWTDFSGLNEPPTDCAQRITRSTPDWRGDTESLLEEDTGQLTTVSSANSNGVCGNSRALDRVLIYRRNRIGPRCDPWGTPDWMGWGVESELPTRTVSWRFDK